MNHYTSSVAQQARVNQMGLKERRAAPRKALHCRVAVGLSESVTLLGQSIDLSPAGLRVGISHSLRTPQECAVDFTMMIDGRPRAVSARGRILSCVCSGMDGFSIGIQFTQINEPAKAIIARFLG